MNTAAKHVMRELTTDIVLAYGDSDEYREPLGRPRPTRPHTAPRLEQCTDV